jgi:hypothetical protein
MFARALGAPARWFCAPRWQAPRGIERLLPRHGLAGHFSTAAILPCGRAPIPLPALNFDEGERRAIAALARARRTPRIARHLAAGAPFRFVIHPDDLDHPATLDQIRRLRDRLDAEGWRPMTLAELAEAGP